MFVALKDATLQTNVVLLFVFLFLMGLAILTSFYGEDMSTASSFYDDNWEDIKQEIRDKDPHLCTDLTDSECKSRFKSKSSKQIAFVAYGCAGVEAFLVSMQNCSPHHGYRASH